VEGGSEGVGAFAPSGTFQGGGILRGENMDFENWPFLAN